MNMKKLLPILLVLCLALSGCAPARPGTPETSTSEAPAFVHPSQTPVQPISTLPQASATVTRTPRPTATEVPTVTLTPTPIPTATPDPAVFDPSTFGDIRKVDSFVVTTVWKETGQDYLYDSETRSEYNRNPAGFHDTSTFHGFNSYSYPPDTTTSGDAYWLGEWAYYKDNLTAKWRVTRAAKENYNVSPLDNFDLAKIISISWFKSAKYLGVEQYKGIPAYHYSFDETNLMKLENVQVEKASGELFVSVEGRYPLHSYARFSGKIIPAPGQDPPWAEGVDERTQDLVSFNQPVQISLPADYPNYDLNPDFPLPSGSVLNSVYQVEGLEKSYQYITPVNEEEFKAFYASLVPTNGWTASKPVDLSGPVIWCEACFSFSKGGQQVVLEFSDEIVNFKHKDYVINIYFLAKH